MTTYLVTGATGFIGRHVVRMLLERESTTEVLVLTRPDSAEKLARTTLGWPQAVKVRPVEGDVRSPALGVGEATVAELRGKVDHVVHLAALYDMTASEEDNQLANVDGTKHLLELAAAIEAGRVHHISSIAVAGDHAGKFTEDMFDVGQSLPSPYHRTKFESEKLVREATSVPWRVYRPAIVVGDSKTGEMDKVDGIYYLFPTIARLARLPEVPLVAPELGNTNVVPVDYVAAAIVHLMHEPGLDGRAFHLVNPKPQALTDVYNAFAHVAGAPQIAVRLGDTLSNPARAIGKLAERLPGAGLVRDAVLHRLDIPPEVFEFAGLPTVFDTLATREALRSSGLEVPRLTDYAEVLWRYWREHLDPYRARKHGPRGELDGRRVVVTGASSGIGRATALKLAAEGAIPLLVARRASELEEVRREILAAGGQAGVYPCDLTDDEAVAKTVEQMLHEYGGIEMLVNNAGRSIRRSVTLSYDRFHDYERAMAINYFGSVRLILALLPHMTERKFGHIVNVSSIGVQGIAPRFSAYVASKAALDYFARIVATETHGKGVTFTTVHMPLVRTPMIRPTKIYDAFPAKSPEAAADMIITALKKRPKQMGTPYGAAIGLAYSLAPGFVDAVAYQGYQVFPESAAAGGERGETNKKDRRVTQLATTLMKLTRGFHW
ncbi:SDR family oxidoreductase [Sciscionella sediminilitoris]|uniref:SDR family oxidoreductase n=1 Tax=Sciscionella sediminilitoris TaxID=1445613 RepID=UPI0004DF2B41|nr:SDR family oxidoreductase [Sciscionella sp. SE31]